MLRKLLPLVLVGIAGCAGRTTYVIDNGPPAPRSEVVIYRPGHVWVQGHWVQSRRGWVWQDGHYERERPDMVYVGGRWERRGHRFVYVNGGWRPRGHVVIRDRY